MGWKAAASFGGTAISSALGMSEAAKNRKFQKHMYKHRFQYSMQDMRKAGLNPMLAAGMGLGGGGSPSGSMASIPDLGRAGATAVEEGKAGQSKKLMASQRAQITQAIATSAAQANTYETQASLNRAAGLKMVQDTATSAAQERNLNASAIMTTYGHTGAALQADIDASEWGRGTAKLERGTRLIPNLGILLGGGRRGKSKKQRSR